VYRTDANAVAHRGPERAREGLVQVPLSEEEQRILSQIEQQFYAHDRELAHSISSETLVRHLARNCRWAAGAFVIGLVVLLLAFASSWVLGLFGFAVMLAAAVVFVQNLRKMGQHGLEQLRAQLRSRQRNDDGRFDALRERWNRRFRSD
jgi:hypothetical protein